MTGPQWVMGLPWSTPPLSANGSRGNPYAHARTVKAVRECAWALATQARIPPLGRAIIQVRYAPRDKRRRDPQNLAPMQKACEDGIVDAGVLTDDVPELSIPVVPAILPATGEPGRLWLVVTQVQGPVMPLGVGFGSVAA